MKRHLPEPAHYSRLRKYLAALPHGMPTSFTWVLAAAVVATPIFTVRAILPALGGGARDRNEEVQPNASVVDARGREGSHAAWTVTREIPASPGAADPGTDAPRLVATAVSPVSRPDGGDLAQDRVDEASADPGPSVEPSASASPSDFLLGELGEVDHEPGVAKPALLDRSVGTVVDSPPAPSIDTAERDSTPNPDVDDQVHGPARDQPSLEDRAPASDPVSGGGHGHDGASDRGEASDDDREADHRQTPSPMPGQPASTKPPENADD